MRPPAASAPAGALLGGAPVTKFRALSKRAAGRTARATVGATLHSITLNKRYRDQQSDEWKDSSSFFPDDLPRLRLLLDKAYEHIRLREGSSDRNQNGLNGPDAPAA